MKTPNAFAAAYAKLPPIVKSLPGQTKMFTEEEAVGNSVTEADDTREDECDEVSNS
jgi:hypothetical protein